MHRDFSKVLRIGFIISGPHYRNFCGGLPTEGLRRGLQGLIIEIPMQGYMEIQLKDSVELTHVTKLCNCYGNKCI